MVSLIKEVYGEEEFEKHNNGIDWLYKADRCNYVFTPEQGANECAFYALKVMRTFNGEKFAETWNKKICELLFFCNMIFNFLFSPLMCLCVFLHFLAEAHRGLKGGVHLPALVPPSKPDISSEVTISPTRPHSPS